MTVEGAIISPSIHSVMTECVALSALELLLSGIFKKTQILKFIRSYPKGS